MKNYVWNYTILIASLVFIVLIGLLIAKGCEKAIDIDIERKYSRLYDSKMLICYDSGTYKLIKNFKFIRFKNNSLYVFDNDTDKFYDALDCRKYSDMIRSKN